MLRIVNRVLLGLAGLVLTAVGAGVLLGGLDLPRPGFSPFSGRSDVLLSASARTSHKGADWWWPVVIGGLSLLVLLGLWWFAAQLRRRRLGEVLIDTGEEGSSPQALLRGRALEDVLAAEAGALEGVERASVTLRGRRTAPQARMGLLLGPRAKPSTAIASLRTRTLKEACASTGLPSLPTEVRLRAVKHRPDRVT